MSTSPSTCNTGRETQEEHSLELGAGDTKKFEIETKRLCRQLRHVSLQPHLVDQNTFDDQLIFKSLPGIAKSADDVDLGKKLLTLFVHDRNALLRRGKYLSDLVSGKWQNVKDVSCEIQSDPCKLAHHVVVKMRDGHPDKATWCLLYCTVLAMTHINQPDQIGDDVHIREPVQPDMG